MPTNTLYLASILLAEGDNNKYLVVNNALQQLEDSINRILAVDMTSGNVTLTESQYTNYGIFVCSGHTVARDLILPVTVGANPATTTNRQITVRNDGTVDGVVTVTHNVAGEEVAIAIATGAVCIADGTDIKNVSLLTSTQIAPASGDVQLLPFAFTSRIDNATSWNRLGTDVPGTGGSTGTVLFVDNSAGIIGATFVGTNNPFRYENPAMRPSTGTDFDYVMKVNMNVPEDSFAIGGVYVELNSTNKVFAFGKFYTGDWFRQYWNANTFSSEVSVSSGFIGEGGQGGGNWYIRLKRVSTALEIYVSTDGLLWMLMHSETIATFLVDIDRVGIFYNAGGQAAGTVGSVVFTGMDDDGPQVRAGAKLTADVVAVTSSRSLVDADRGNFLDVSTSSGAIVLTIDPDATTDLAIGTILTVILNDITNSLTITAGTGVDLNFTTAGSGVVTSTLASSVSVYKRAADSWIARGDIGAIS